MRAGAEAVQVGASFVGGGVCEDVLVLVVGRCNVISILEHHKMLVCAILLSY